MKCSRKHFYTLLLFFFHLPSIICFLLFFTYSSNKHPYLHCFYHKIPVGKLLILCALCSVIYMEFWTEVYFVQVLIFRFLVLPGNIQLFLPVSHIYGTSLPRLGIDLTSIGNVTSIVTETSIFIYLDVLPFFFSFSFSINLFFFLIFDCIFPFRSFIFLFLFSLSLYAYFQISFFFFYFSLFPYFSSFSIFLFFFFTNFHFFLLSIFFFPPLSFLPFTTHFFFLLSLFLFISFFSFCLNFYSLCLNYTFSILFSFYIFSLSSTFYF